MKISRSSKEQGGVLLLVLFTCLSIGIVLASFLALTSSRNKMAVRSNGWNQCIPVLEAGIEEALTHMHEDFSPMANGWTPTVLGGQSVVVKKRTLPDGSYYNVTIYNAYSNAPTIYSQGFVPSPLQVNKYISRLVRVGVTNPISVFIRAIATSGPISMNSGNNIVDGYDSTKGPYNTISNRTATGGIATSSTANPAINLQGAHIYGTVETGPGGTVAVGSGGSVGDTSWYPGHTGVEPGWSNNTMNVSFPPNPLPTGMAAAPAPVVPLLYTSGTNKVASINLSGSSVLTVAGKAVVYVQGNVKITGGASIQILPGASLTLYVGGTIDVTGGGIVNQGGTPANLSIVGLASCTSIKLGGNSDFYGTVNAPQAAVTMSGGADLYGAIIAASFTAGGSGSVHYDNSLAKKGDPVVLTWVEL